MRDRPAEPAPGVAVTSRCAPFMVISLALAAAGCATVGPNFEEPQSPSPTRYASPGERSLSGADAVSKGSEQTQVIGGRVRGDWWTLFRSSDLDQLVAQAIAGSPTLESAGARLRASEEEVRASTGALYPQVSVGAGFAREKESAAAFGLKPNVAPLPPNFNLLQVGPTVSYDLDLFGGTRRRIEQKVALADLRSDELDAAYITLTGNTVSQAIQLASVRAQLKAANGILEIDRQTLELVRKERDVGTAPDSDVVVAETQLATDKTLLPVLEQQLSVAKHALAVLAGLAPGDWSPPDFNLETLTLPGELPVSLPSELVHQRPDIRAAEAQLHAASAQIGIATAQLYPTITLSAGITAYSLNGSSLFNPSNLLWSTAAGLVQPVFDGGARRAERRAALADFKAAAADYRQTVLQAFGQVGDVLEALTHDADLLAAQQDALESAAKSVRLQRDNYTKGGAGILNLLDAQRQYQQASLGYARVQAQRYQDSVQLLVAMGGGWWDANLKLAADASPTRGERR